MVIIETRVKHDKAYKVKGKLKLVGNRLDNLYKHDNGRIWMMWNDSKLEARHVDSTE